jgi:hypothetical protein
MYPGESEVRGEVQVSHGVAGIVEVALEILNIHVAVQLWAP